MDLLRIISIFVLIIGLTFLMAEFLTEEAEFFAPLAILTIIIGLILFFLSDPKEWFGITRALYPFFVVIIISIASVPIIVSLILLFKIRAIKNKPPELLDFINKPVKVIKAITPGQKGYVLFRGENWRAVSSEVLKEGERGIVEAVDTNGLTLTVRKAPPEQEPSEKVSKTHEIKSKTSRTDKCPFCSTKVEESYRICPNCGSELNHS